MKPDIYYVQIERKFRKCALIEKASCALIRIGQTEKMASAAESVLRVNQLDACELDENIADILQHQFMQIFTPLDSVRIHQFEPELKAIVRFLLWKFSLSAESSSFAQRMLNLTYANGTGQLTPFQRGGLFFSLVIAEWLLERCDWIMTKLPSLAPLQQTFTHGMTALKLLSLLNFTVFLIQGCYPTLKERLLALKIAPTHPQSLRDVSHSYMTREILWHGFSEFLFFVLPHFNLFALWNRIKQMCTAPALNHSLCAFCEAPPTMPHLSSCGHTYCYYCLSANMKADPNYSCVICSDKVHSYTPTSELS